MRSRLRGLVLLGLSLGLAGCQFNFAQLEGAGRAGDIGATLALASTATRVVLPTIQEAPIQPTLTPSPTQTAIPTITDTPMPTATPTATEIPGFRTAQSDGMEQVYIPSGDFLMGSDDIEAQHVEKGNGVAYIEVPPHTVHLDAYWMDRYEVSNAQYARCVEAGACSPPFSKNSYTYYRYFSEPAYANYPVVYVNWWNARDYCAWAGRRLPSEAEWEKAARGTDARKYPWGNEKVSNERANFCDRDCPKLHIANPNFNDGYADTAPVGSYPAGASPYGVMDMAGNVWEWTNSIPAPYPYNAADGREDPEAYAQRVWRGGTWANGTWYLRATVRYRSVQKYTIHSLGFRCAE